MITNLPIDIPVMTWSLLGCVALGLAIIISSRRRGPVIRTIVRILLMAIFVVPWIAIAYALLGIPLTDIDLSIHVGTVTIPSAFIKLTWLGFDIFLLYYWLSELVKFIRQKRNRG
jgi:ABC-type spermidine/putrescine transport system permease subunit II